MNKKKTAAIVLAAGQGKRMNSDVPKQFLLLGDRPIIYYSLKAIEESFIDEVILVTGEDDISFCQKEVVDRYQFGKVKKIISGGKERYHSVARGLYALEDCDYVFIHDGARPFLNGEILERLYREVCLTGACVAGMPSKDTVKIVDESGYAVETPRRDLVWITQTPQVFSYRLVRTAYDIFLESEEEMINNGMVVTDDAMLVEHFTEHKVRMIEGDYRNIKITTPEDLPMAESILKKIKKL